jgi:raffinose/stachyose/melibiose transport system permease protein
METKTKNNLSFKEKLEHAKSNGSISVWLMMFPSIFLLCIVSIYPFCWLIKYVFYDYNGFVAYFIGFNNFKRALTDQIYWTSVMHTFEYAVLKLVVILPLALAVAVLLNQKIKGSNFLRAIYFLPTIISAAIYSLIFYFIFASYNGVLNGMLQTIGIIDKPIDWLGSSSTAMNSIIVVAVWGGFGNYMILFISGLNSISDEVYESAQIDGANAITTFFKITLPLLGPMLKVILMLAITTALKDYESILVLTGGGPNNRTQVMFSYIYTLCFGSDSVSTNVQIGYGAVLSVISAMIIGVVTVIYLKISKKLDDLY